MEGIVMESVWVAVGFVVFVALIWRRVGAAVGGMLDDRSQKITQDLDEARALREEALEELHQFQRLHRAEQIIALTRGHLLTMETKLDVLEGAITVLDRRTRDHLEHGTKEPSIEPLVTAKPS